MTGRSRIRGVAKVRRLMRRMPQAVQDEIVGTLDVAGAALRDTMRARTPQRSGALRAGITYKVFPKTLKLRVGLFGTKGGKVQRGKAKGTRRTSYNDLFYDRIIEFGRKAQTVRVTRGTTVSNSFHARRKRAAGTALAKPYLLRVKAYAGKRFVTGRMPELRQIINRDLKNIWQRALSKVAEGGDG